MEYQKEFFALGTENMVYMQGDHCKEAMDSILERISEIDDKMSAFKPQSEISRISLGAGISPTKVSNDVYYVLKKALEISRISHGAFDMTVRPLTKLWNFGHQEQIPRDSEIKALLYPHGQVGYQHLILDDSKQTAFLEKYHCSIDLGGIAKGYAADEARSILQDFGMKNALINLGGNIITLGKNPQGEAWNIGIQNPLLVRGEACITVRAENQTIVTSAVNERFFIKDGIRYHHILDARTGYPAQSGLISVTVIDECSLKADAVSTAAFVLGIQKGTELVNAMNSKAIFVTENGDIFSTNLDIDPCFSYGISPCIRTQLP